MMGKILLILLIAFCLTIEPGFAEEKKPDSKPNSLSKEDRKIIMLMETLNLLDLVDNITLVEDLDILTEEKPNEKND